MPTSSFFNLLKSQGYHIVGNHSAVKRCKWYKESLLGRGECYKAKFYGIKSHQCMQCTPCLQFCNQECVFCWRVQERDLTEKGLVVPKKPIEITNLKKFKWDEPAEIFEGMLKEQLQFAIGYKGHPKADKNKVQEAFNPKLLTLSLAGEPTLYPKLGELIDYAKKRGFLVFLVTNGTLPQALKKLKKTNSLPTQLYISMDAPDFESYKKTCRPIEQVRGGAEKTWKKYLESLKLMKELKGKTRTVLRMTLVRGYNDRNLEGYAKQIIMAQPDYVEVKSFVYVGGARSENRGLKLEDMLKMGEVKAIAKTLSELTGYKYSDEHIPSRVVLLVRDAEAERKRNLKRTGCFTVRDRPAGTKVLK